MREIEAEIRRRVEAAGLSPTREADVIAELVQHADDRRDELRATGMSDEAARAAILAEIDSGPLVAGIAPEKPEPSLGAGPSGWSSGVLHDVRYAARSLRKSRGFTAVTLLSLALGIGANAALFGLIDALRFRPLPVVDPDRLAIVSIKDRKWATGAFSGLNPDLTYGLWQELREHQEVFSGVAVWSDRQMNLAPSGDSRWSRGLFVSGSFFGVAGVPPFLGRTLGPADDQRGCAVPPAVVSHGFWQRELGSDPSAIGRSLTLDRHLVQVVGVTAPGFHGLDVGHTFDVAVPLCAEPLFRPHSFIDLKHGWWLGAVGRLRPGVTLEQAAAFLDGASAAWFARTVPDYAPDEKLKYLAHRLTATSAAAGKSDLRKRYSSALYLLLGTAGLVLLIACANLANLLLARAAAREREIAVRLALGASRARLIRQLMTESLLLALVGAALGLGLAQALASTIVSFMSTPGDPTLVDLAPDWRVLGFTVALAIVTCVLFGLAPALRASRADVGLVLKAAGRSTTAGRDKVGLRRILVVTQLALSFVLLVGALLFSRSLLNLTTVDVGFRSAGVLVAGVDLRSLAIGAGELEPTIKRILDGLGGPPFDGAARTAIVPLTGQWWNERVFEGTPAAGKEVNFSSVSPGYFDMLEIPRLAGRTFDAHDADVGAPLVAVVNAYFARELLAGESPIGRSFHILGDAGGSPERVFQVVGVVGDTRYSSMREAPNAVAYLSVGHDAEPITFPVFLVHSRAGHIEAAEALRRTILSVVPEASIDIDVLDRSIDEGFLRDRLIAALSVFFGLLAVLLVAVGLYGVVAYSVARRTHEIGIRMALGARGLEVRRMILGDALRVTGLGVIIGAVLAVGAAQAARAMLFGLAPHDPLTFVAAVVLLGTVATLASLIPASRASRVDPIVALREE